MSVKSFSLTYCNFLLCVHLCLYFHSRISFHMWVIFAHIPHHGPTKLPVLCSSANSCYRTGNCFDSDVLFWESFTTFWNMYMNTSWKRVNSKKQTFIRGAMLVQWRAITSMYSTAVFCLCHILMMSLEFQATCNEDPFYIQVVLNCNEKQPKLHRVKQYCTDARPNMLTEGYFSFFFTWTLLRSLSLVLI